MREWIEVFMRINITLVLLAVLDGKDFYMSVVGILGIIWAIIPAYDFFKKVFKNE